MNPVLGSLSSTVKEMFSQEHYQGRVFFFFFDQTNNYSLRTGIEGGLGGQLQRAVVKQLGAAEKPIIE